MNVRRASLVAGFAVLVGVGCSSSADEIDTPAEPEAVASTSSALEAPYCAGSYDCWKATLGAKPYILYCGGWTSYCVADANPCNTSLCGGGTGTKPPKK